MTLRLRASLAAACLVAIPAAAPGLAAAGPDSQVASSFDADDSFDLHLLLDYDFQLRSSSVRREQAGAADDGAVPIGDELAYRSARHLLTPRLELGVFHDLALTLALPIVVLDTRQLELDGRDRTTSSTIADGLLPSAGYDADDPATGFPGDDALLFRGVDRKGLDQLHLGFVGALMNQRRDDTKPTWKVGAQLRLSVGAPARFDRDDPDAETGVGSGVHELYVFTSMARRIGWAEPYFEAWWLAPIGVTEDSPFQDPGFGARSTDKQQQAGTRFGFEAIVVDKGPDKQRVSLDLSARINAFFEGRGYSEMWEVFALAGDSEGAGPLILDDSPTMSGLQALSHPGVTNIENYLEAGGRLALRADLGKVVHVAAIAEVTRETRHLISFTDAGVDLPRCDAGETSGCEAETNDVVNPGTAEVSPLHVPIIDLVGHRYIVQGATNLRFGVEAHILF